MVLQQQYIAKNSPSLGWWQRSRCSRISASLAISFIQRMKLECSQIGNFFTKTKKGHVACRIKRISFHSSKPIILIFALKCFYSEAWQMQSSMSSTSLESVPSIGDRAPDFELPDVDQKWRQVERI